MVLNKGDIQGIIVHTIDGLKVTIYDIAAT